MGEPFNYAIVIGRFQPFHNGHMGLMRTAFATGEHVIVVLGSADSSRTCKNPFTEEERERMIRGAVQDEGIDLDRLTFIYVRDNYYNDALWMQELHQKVMSHAYPKASIALVGFRKDASSFYLDMFPQWTFVAHQQESMWVMDATEVRELWFQDDPAWTRMVPASTVFELAMLQEKPIYNMLVEQYKYLKEYPTIWGTGPFVTVDAVVTMKGHILLVRRGQVPGKGLWALPGGFLNPDERLMDAAVRELIEETGLTVFTPQEIKNTLVAKEIFDHPNRSERGRTITTAFHFALDRIDFPHLPNVSGSDDASDARWVPIYVALKNSRELYEDHASILFNFISRGSGILP